MMMFRDSYTKYLYPYLCYNFHRSSYIWINTFYRDLVEEEKPDMVIWEMSERFIPFFFIYKNPPFQNTETKKQSQQNILMNLLNNPNIKIQDLLIINNSATFKTSLAN